MLMRCTPSVSRPNALACLGKAPARLHASHSSSTPFKSLSSVWASSLAGRQAAAGRRGVAVSAGTASADGEELHAFPKLYAVDHAINDVDVHIMLSGAPEAAAQLLKTVPVSSLLLASHSRVLLAAAAAAGLDAAGSGGDAATAATAAKHAAAAAGRGQHQGRRSVEVLVRSAEAAEAVETCLRFMYSGAVPAQLAAAASLEAQRLGMWPCHYTCVAALAQTDLPHACPHVFNKLYSRSTAIEKAMRLPAVLRKYGSTALIRDNLFEWQQLQVEVVHDVLYNDAFASGSEDEVLGVIEQWLQSPMAYDVQHAQQLLHALRLLQLGPGIAGANWQCLHALMQKAGMSSSLLVDFAAYQSVPAEQRAQLEARLPPAWLRTDPRPTQLAVPPPPPPKPSPEE